VQLEIALLNARGFIKIMASRGGGAKRNRTLLYFNFIKKKKIREDEKNEQDNRQQGKH